MNVHYKWLEELGISKVHLSVSLQEFDYRLSIVDLHTFVPNSLDEQFESPQSTCPQVATTTTRPENRC
jgi:hypothetical protein